MDFSFLHPPVYRIPNHKFNIQNKFERTIYIKKNLLY